MMTTGAFFNEKSREILSGASMGKLSGQVSALM